MSVDRQLPPDIFKHWKYSYEDKDNRDGVSVFRSSAYNFPPSRGRSGFEIKKNGEFILHEVGPSDRPVKKVGIFKVEGPAEIKVYFDDKTASQFSLKILDVGDNILRVQRL